LTIPDKVLKWTAVALFAAIVALLIFGAIKKFSYDAKILELQNSLASKDKTIEVTNGVYEKLMLEHANLKDLLDRTNSQVDSLVKELDKRDEDLLAVNNLVVYWKHKYDAKGAGTQTTIPGAQPGQPNSGDRIKVAFAKDFGYVGVEGFTLTSPPEYWISIANKRPLKLTLVVGRLKDGSWKADVTSNDDNVGVDIAIAAVNPGLLDMKWYERLGLSLDVGVGARGFLGGAGVSIYFDAFELGPKVWFNVGANGVDPFYGASMTWHPFHK
jgi:uncharacterized coiled-coil protein SlyX